MALGKAYRKPVGAVVMAVLAVLAFGGSAWIWDNVSNEDAVSTILVAIGLVTGLLLAQRVMKLPIANRALRLGLLAVVAAGAVYLAVVLGGLDLGDSGSEVPTMLFGLGAIGLSKEPRGVVYDIVNRQRLRRFKDAERKDEEASRRVEDLQPVGVQA